MRFARWSFALAALYGLAAALSLYVRVPLTAQAQWLYLFAGAAAATQLAYLLIARDPIRYRPLMPIGIVSKLSFAIPVVVLYVRGDVPPATLAFGLVDLALAALFAINLARLTLLAAPTPHRPPSSASR